MARACALAGVGRRIIRSLILRLGTSSGAEITHEAARGAVDPTALIEFAETRAGGDHGYGAPNMLRAGVDWLREARPEAADLRNYLVWWLLTNPGHPKAHDMFLALRHVTLLYDLLIRDGD